jgi:hypothetical protein
MTLMRNAQRDEILMIDAKLVRNPVDFAFFGRRDRLIPRQRPMFNRRERKERRDQDLLRALQSLRLGLFTSAMARPKSIMRLQRAAPQACSF